MDSDYTGNFAAYLKSYWEIILVVGLVLLLAAIAVIALWRKHMLKKISLNEKMEAQKRQEKLQTKARLRESQAKLRQSMVRMPKHAQDEIKAKVNLENIAEDPAVPVPV